MTWSKQYTSSVAVADIDSDTGTSMLTVLDEVFDTWLPSRGWTTAKQAGTRPHPTTTFYHWWMDKSIQLIDSSTYNHRVEFILNPGTVERFGYNTWPAGVTADSQYSMATNVTGDGLTSDVEGVWEFWTSDQDTDSFLIVTKGTPRCPIGFMPPTGSIFPCKDYANVFPLRFAPLLISSGNGNLWHNLNSTLGIYPAFRPYSPSPTSHSGVVMKFNAAMMQSGITSGSEVAFVTSTNDCSMLFQPEDTNSMNECGTLQVGSEYFIRVGTSGNSLLLSTGTTDPQI